MKSNYYGWLAAGIACALLIRVVTSTVDSATANSLLIVVTICAATSGIINAINNIGGNGGKDGQ